MTHQDVIGTTEDGSPIVGIIDDDEVDERIKLLKNIIFSIDDLIDYGWDIETVTDFDRAKEILQDVLEKYE